MKKNRKSKGAAKPEAAFAAYLETLTEPEAAAVSDFFCEFDAHCLLKKRQKDGLRRDFESALLYFHAAGTPLPEALERLSIRNLGGFYARPPILWYPLDDAAKIYPLSMKHGQMAVFRLSAYLKQPVVPELLQMALNFTIKRFPSFATTVKKGFFWHYLDTAKRRFAAEPDNGVPCRALRVGESGSQSFRVLYYENRISVEYFHILTDGTGGMCFLKTLTAEYLRLCGSAISYGGGVLDPNAPPAAGETANEFDRAERTENAAGFVDKPVVQMSGRLSKSKPRQVLHFKMDGERLKAAARAKDATVTAYLLAQMFVAGRRATDELAGDMSIQVPVNMRKFYPSETVRNFAMYCGVRLPIESIASVEAILPEIARQLAEKAAKDAMSQMMNATERLVGLVRYVPLFIKAPVARLVYGFLGDRIFCNTLSNLGLVTMPPALENEIESMDFVLGTALTNRASCALVSYGKVSTLSISKMTADPSFEEALYEQLCADGIGVCVEGSVAYED